MFETERGWWMRLVIEGVWRRMREEKMGVIWTFLVIGFSETVKHVNE